MQGVSIYDINNEFRILRESIDNTTNLFNKILNEYHQLCQFQNQIEQKRLKRKREEEERLNVLHNKRICSNMSNDKKIIKLIKQHTEEFDPMLFPFEIALINNENFVSFANLWKSKTIYSWSLILDIPFFTEQQQQPLKVLSCDDDISGGNFPLYLFRILGICVTWNNFITYILPLTDKQQYEIRWQLICERFSDPKAAKILWNMKHQLKVLMEFNVQINGTLMDPKIADWLINTNTNKSRFLSQLIKQYLEIEITTTSFDSLVDDACYRSYYSFVTMTHLLENDLPKQDNIDLFLKVEMPLIEIIATMERNGIGFQYSILENERKEIELKMKSLHSQVIDLLKNQRHTPTLMFEVNLNKPMDVAFILYNYLHLPKPKEEYLKQQNQGMGSTSELALNDLKDKHPIVNLILEHRKLSGIIDKYVIGLKPFPQINPATHESRLFPVILSTEVASGRLAADKPNIQAIANPISYIPVEEEEKTNPKIKTVSIRSAFVAPRGKLFLSFDYEQLEIRVLIQLSQDQALFNLLNQTGDFFINLAKQWFKKQNIVEQERNIIKQICYGVINGIGPKKVSQSLSTSKKEAQELILKFKQNYSGVTDFQKSIIRQCESLGYVQTFLKRRRYLPEILSENIHEKEKAQRQAVSHILQGTAADIMKTAIISISNTLKLRKKGDIKLVLELHDELIYEVDENSIDTLAPMIKKMMENASKILSFVISTPVRIKKGQNWASLKNMKIN